jgi:hypothetical protein
MDKSHYDGPFRGRVECLEWIGLAQDRYRWRALVNAVMKLRVLYALGNYRVAA